MVILAANKWSNNSEMIQDVRDLGYIKEDDLVFDATYHKGTWWKGWRPKNLISNSLDNKFESDIIADFRWAPFTNDTFDVVAYDPPYVSKGNRKNSNHKEHQERYGLTDAPKSPAALQILINSGLQEMTRIVKPKGIILAKCQDYISSGNMWWGTHLTRRWAEEVCHLRAVDRLYFINNGSAQPQRWRRCPDCDGDGGDHANGIPCGGCGATGKVPSKQQHARVNVSTLWIFRKLK